MESSGGPGLKGACYLKSLRGLGTTEQENGRPVYNAIPKAAPVYVRANELTHHTHKASVSPVGVCENGRESQPGSYFNDV